MVTKACKTFLNSSMTHVYFFKTNSVEKRPLYVGVSRLAQLSTIEPVVLSNWRVTKGGKCTEFKSLIYCISNRPESTATAGSWNLAKNGNWQKKGPSQRGKNLWDVNTCFS